MMRDIDKALADISSIKSQLAAGTMFRGFGPAVMALTGLIALSVAAVQAWVSPPATPQTYVAAWVITAGAAIMLSGVEVIARTRRQHGGLADAILINALEQFLPAAFAGIALTAVIWTFAPAVLWTLPGLWQVLVSLGLFAAGRTLPREVRWVAGWYMVTGCAALALTASSPALNPWVMGLPFGIGQLALAAVLKFAYGEYPANDR
jgi:hypothetical protein